MFWRCPKVAVSTYSYFGVSLCCVFVQCCVSVPSCVSLSSCVLWCVVQCAQLCFSVLLCVLWCVVQCSACATCRQLLTSVCPRGRTQARQQPPKSCLIFRPNQSDFLKKKYSWIWANLRLYPRTDYPPKWTSAPVPSSSITRLLSLWKSCINLFSVCSCSCSHWLCENFSFVPFFRFFCDLISFCDEILFFVWIPLLV